MNYNYEMKYENLLLKPLQKDEIENLRIWRNKQSECKYLRDVGQISEAQQLNWYNNYLKNSNETFFSIHEIKTINKMVGAVSIYNIDNINKKAEVGRIQIGDNNAHGLGIGKKSLIMIMYFGFKILNLEYIYGTVNKDNMPALINDISLGFKIIGEENSQSLYGGKEFMIDIDFNRFSKINDWVNNIIIEGFN